MGNSSRRDTSKAYTLREAARRIGIHYETAARWVRSGRLPALKISPRKILIPRQVCDSLARGEVLRPSHPGDTGLPHRWLFLAGTLTPAEARRLRRTVEEFDRQEMGEAG